MLQRWIKEIWVAIGNPFGWVRDGSIDSERVAVFWLVRFSLLLLISLPFVLTRPGLLPFNDQTGVVGDTIGGLLGPLVGFLTALLTYKAFMVQYQTNRQQSIEIDKERERAAKRDFEAIFFNLLNMHRKNVDDFYIALHYMHRADEPGANWQAIERRFSGKEGLSHAYHAMDDISRRVLQFIRRKLKELHKNYPVQYGIAPDIFLRHDENLGLHLFLSGAYHGVVNALRQLEKKHSGLQFEEKFRLDTIQWVRNEYHASYDRSNRHTYPSIEHNGYLEYLMVYLRHIINILNFITNEDYDFFGSNPESRWVYLNIFWDLLSLSEKQLVSKALSMGGADFSLRSCATGDELLRRIGINPSTSS